MNLRQTGGRATGAIPTTATSHMHSIARTSSLLASRASPLIGPGGADGERHRRARRCRCQPRSGPQPVPGASQDHPPCYHDEPLQNAARAALVDFAAMTAPPKHSVGRNRAWQGKRAARSCGYFESQLRSFSLDAAARCPASPLAISLRSLSSQAHRVTREIGRNNPKMTRKNDKVRTLVASRATMTGIVAGRLPAAMSNRKNKSKNKSGSNASAERG
jgi:hypothetical protein